MIARPREISTELLESGLPAIGYIKIGIKKPTSGGAMRPSKIDHFRITTRKRLDDGNLELDTAIHEKIGPKPTFLDVRLPFDTRPENFRAEMTLYAGRTRKERECDGRTCTLVQEGTTEPCRRLAGKECKCKPWGRLAVMLEAGTTVGGVHVFQTTSWESVRSIQTALGVFEEQFGSLRGLPLRLHMYPAEVQFTGSDGKRGVGTAYKVGLLLRATWEEAREAAIGFHRENQIAKSTILQLSAGTEANLDELEQIEEAEIVDEYFQPAVEPTGSSPLGALNSSLGVEPDQDEAIDGLIDRLKSLVAELDTAHGITLAPAQKEKVDEAIESRDTEKLTKTIEWAERRPMLPAQKYELEALQSLAVQARDATEEGLSFADEKALDQVARALDGPGVREWIHRLTERTSSEED